MLFGKEVLFLRNPFQILFTSIIARIFGISDSQLVPINLVVIPIIALISIFLLFKHTNMYIGLYFSVVQTCTLEKLRIVCIARKGILLCVEVKKLFY